MELINISNINVGEDLIQTVNARDLHTFLGVGKDFSNWIKDRIEMYGFTENVDYIISEILSSPNLASTKARPQLKKEYYVSLDMAKELSMVDRGEKGKEIRKYFLKCEKIAKESLHRAQSLPTTFVEALEMLVESEKKKIELNNKLNESKPKVEFFDAVVESELVHSLSESAKLLGTGRTRFVKFLKAYGYIGKDKTPKQQYIEAGYMDVKFTRWDTGVDIKVQVRPFITGKGLVYFRKKLKEMTENE